MHHRLPPTPPRAGLVIGAREVPAVPVHLDGHEASVVVRPGPRADERGCLRLDWDDGSSTELDVVVRKVAGMGHVARMEVCGVTGDWRPFLEYVARTAS